MRRRRALIAWTLMASLIWSPAWTFAQQPAAKIDVRYITPDAVVGAVARPRAVLTAPAAAMVPTEVITAMGKKEVGIDPLDVTQVTLVVEPPLQGPPAFAVVAHLAVPYTLDQIRWPAHLRLERTQLDGRPYLKSAHPGVPGLYMPEDRTILFGTDELLKRMLAQKQEPADSRLAKQLAGGELTDLRVVVLAEPLRPLLSQQLAQAPLPPPLAHVRRLPELIDMAQAELGFLASSHASLVLQSPGPAEARELASLIQQALDIGQQLTLAQIREQPMGDDPVEQATQQYTERMVRHMFDLLRPEHDGDTVRIAHEGAAESQVAVIGILVALLLPAVQAAREAARRAQSSNHLKQIGLAMHSYHTTFKKFPPRASVDADGKPLLSWRVHLLPYLDQQALYEQFRLDEPWDSEHNRTLINQMPSIYHNPSSAAEPHLANYLAVSGKGAVFEDGEGTPIREITDGMANTILVVEVDDQKSVVWTKPDDFDFNPETPLAGVGAAHPGGFLALLADGSVHFIASTIDPETFLRLLMMADGKPVGPF